MIRRTIATILAIIIDLVILYMIHPALNIKSAVLWFFIIIALAVILASNLVIDFIDVDDIASTCSKVLITVLMALTVMFGLIWFVSSSKLFHATAYSRLIQVDSMSMNSIPSIDDNLPLMDTISAEVLGSKELGSLTELVGQFEDDNYRQINYNGNIDVVAPLRYKGFFKWLKQRYSGVPGYIHVNTGNQTAEYVEIGKGMRIIPSAYLSDDAARYLWKCYPTLMFRNIHFELEDDGTPKIVAPYIDNTIGLFGGSVIKGAVIMNPSTGESQLYDLNSIPDWVDIVWDGELIETLYNYYGSYKNGFFNSLFGQVGCSRTTADYGYIVDGNDVAIFTGITSLASNDGSNIGFLIANERTGKLGFITIASSNEQAAMSSAEGEIQEKGYNSSFPSLALLDDNIVYVSVLTDNGGYVKDFSIVNATQVNNVVVANSKKEAIKKYRLLNRTGSNDTAESTEGGIAKSVRMYSNDGISYIEIEDKEGNIIKYILEE